MLGLLLIRSFARGGIILVGDAEFAIKFLHQMDVSKDQKYEDIDGALLCPPKAELEAEERYLVQLIHQQNAKTKRHDEPDAEQNAQ